jgi:hypothetical protein
MSTIKTVHNMYGESVYRNYTPQHMAAGNVQPAPPGGAEYTGRGRCQANNDTCDGWPAKGSTFCIGHLRAMAKAEGAPDPVTKKGDPDGQG